MTVRGISQVISGGGGGGSGGGVTTVPYTPTIPLTFAGTAYMPMQTISAPVSFTLGANPVLGALVYVRLIADGVNTPTFSGFRQWGGSQDYYNTNRIVNIIQFFYDGVDAWYSIAQEVNAQPVPLLATLVTLSGPTSGVVSTASSNFSVGVNGSLSSTVVVTPADGGNGGVFSPTSVNLTSVSPTATFTYTPASTGTKTINVTNNGGLANPTSIGYVVSASATVPAAPTIGTAVAGDGYVDVFFTRNSNGGASVIDSTATLSNGQTATGASSPIRVTSPNNTAVTATVKDRNSVGQSNASAASNSVTPTAVVTGGNLRLGSLDKLVESGTGPYTYTMSTGSGSFGTQGGVSTLSRPASTDVSALLVNTTGNELIYGVTQAANAAFTSMDFAIWTGTGGSSFYTPIVGGSIGSATATAKQTGDVIRMSFVGTTIVVEVARQATPTAFSTVYTFTGVSAAARKYAVNIATNGSFNTGASAGLA